MKDLSEQTHYEVLELAPGCAGDDLARAYTQAKERYGPGSLATYALVEPGESEALLRRVEEAFAVLSDPDRRQAYDSVRGFIPQAAPREAFESRAAPAAGDGPPASPRPPASEAVVAAAPEPAAVPVHAPVAPAEPEVAPPSVPPTAPLAISPPMPEAVPEHKPVHKTESDLPVDAAVTGEALRRVREARGLSLKDVEGRTKIGHWHLENIERERYADLPAQVYLRGFLMSFARELKLDPVRVARSYLEQMQVKFQAKPE